MGLPTALPLLEKPKTVKDKVFVILSGRFPLSLIELTNEVKRQYNVSVSFQAVRKAVLQLIDEGVLIKEKKKFSLDKEWILGFIRFGNLLQRQYFSVQKERTKVEIGDNMTIYTFQSLVDLDYVWNGLIRKASSEPKAPKVITFKAVHFWFLIATLAQETELMNELKKKGVRLYYVCYGDTALDKWTVSMYNRIGVKAVMRPKPKDFVDGLNIGTYGNVLIQSTHPPQIAKKIDDFFHRCKRVEDAALVNITDFVTEKGEIPLQVLDDPVVSASVRENTMSLVLSDKKNR
jgi:hypothetical protein